MVSVADNPECRYHLKVRVNAGQSRSDKETKARNNSFIKTTVSLCTGVQVLEERSLCLRVDTKHLFQRFCVPVSLFR